jgi:hypothetical protein
MVPGRWFSAMAGCVPVIFLLACSSVAPRGGDPPSSPSPAYEALWPEDDPFDLVIDPAYATAVSEALFRESRGVRRLQMVASSAVRPEFAVFVEERPGTADGREFRAVCVEANDFIGSALRENIPAERIATRVAEATMDGELVLAVEAVWRGMTRNVRNEETRPLIADGTEYHFSVARIGEPSMSGTTHSPPAGSRAGRLVALASRICEYVAAPAAARQAVREHLLADAKRLAPP